MITDKYDKYTDTNADINGACYSGGDGDIGVDILGNSRWKVYFYYWLLLVDDSNSDDKRII